MNNLSMHFDPAAGAVLGLFALATTWAWFWYGLNPVLLGLFLAAPPIYWLLSKKFKTRDPRLDKLAALSKQVAQGQVTGRLVNISPKDDIGTLCMNINNMLDQFETCFREQQTVLRMATAGKFFRQAQPVGLHGVFRDAMQGSNTSLAIMAETAKQEKEHQQSVARAQAEIAELVTAASRGQFDQRLSESGKSGFFLDLARHLNQLSGNLETALGEVAQTLRAIADGNLTVTVQQSQEGIFADLQQDAQASVERLRQVIGQIQSAADTIETAASEIASGNSDLAARTETQATRLEQTSTGMDHLQTAVGANNATAKEVGELANAAHEQALRAGKQVRSVVSSMEAMEKNSNKISDIIGLINGIAFQTNILALNAAVEAARAGEQGRGFAVVAKEVRSLAQRSGNAADEIKALISESVATVHQGAEHVRTAVSTVEAVVTSFQRVATLIHEINRASETQNHALSRLAEAIQAMDQEVQQNAALVEQAGAATESLEQQAQSLVTTVGVFRLGRQGYVD